MHDPIGRFREASPHAQTLPDTFDSTAVFLYLIIPLSLGTLISWARGGSVNREIFRRNRLLVRRSTAILI